MEAIRGVPEQKAILMVVGVWPHFKASVVRLGNMLCIPMNFDPGGLQLYVQDENNTIDCVCILRPPECLHDLKPYALLEEYMIVEMKDKLVQIMPFGETCTTASPTSLLKKSIADVFKHAMHYADNSYPTEGKNWYHGNESEKAGAFSCQQR
eukprot:scaffold73962_cov36-Attheya_sp.AAC.3